MEQARFLGLTIAGLETLCLAACWGKAQYAKSEMHTKTPETRQPTCEAAYWLVGYS